MQSSGTVREFHPLLGRFPLTVMALAAVLLLFSLAMALHNAGEPDLRASAGVSLAARSTGAPPAAALGAGDRMRGQAVFE